MEAEGRTVEEAKTRQGHGSELRVKERAMNRTLKAKLASDDLMARLKSTKIDPNIEPFLRMLWDYNLIDCSTNPKDSTLETRIKVQKFVYFAQKYFGLQFRYRHTMYLYGPYSTRLTGDYFHIRNICDVPSEKPKGWSRQAEFLDFAKNHNDVKWLEIASTLVYSRLHDHINGSDNLIRYVQKIKRNFQKEFVVRVHDALVQMGFLGE